MGPDNLPFPSHMVNTLKRRGVNPMVLMQQSPMQTQVTPTSPNYDPGMQTPPAPPMPDHPAHMGQPMPPAPVPGQTPMPPQPGQPMTPPAPPQNPFMQSMQPAQPAAVDPQQSEAEAIVSSLGDRLKHHSKQAAKFLDAILAQQQPPEAQAVQ